MDRACPPELLAEPSSPHPPNRPSHVTRAAVSQPKKIENVTRAATQRSVVRRRRGLPEQPSGVVGLRLSTPVARTAPTRPRATAAGACDACAATHVIILVS